MSVLKLRRDYVLRLLYCLTGGGRDINVIVLYHSVGSERPHSIPLAEFTQQMQFLSERFHVVRLCDLQRARQSQDQSKNIAVVTFDDGYADNHAVAAPVMERFGLRGTFFVTSGRMGKQFSTYLGDVPMMGVSEVRGLAARGHEIGAHTVTHPKLTRLSPEDARREIEDSKHALEDQVGANLRSFAYPKGDWNPGVRTLVEAAGFEAAVTIEERLVQNDTDWLALPRLCVGAHMNMAAFKAAVSPALGVYARARKR